MIKLLYFLSLVSLGSFSMVTEANAVPSASKKSMELTQAITAQKPEYTGIVDRVNNIAEQITVKIDNLSNGAFGSGVIIAHQDNTYYVLTAKHVLCAADSKTECIFNGKNQIVTPDRKKHTIEPKTLTIFANWLDLVVVEFQSDEVYQVAIIGDYDVGNQWIFTSGFAQAQDNQASTLVFTVGVLQRPGQADFLVNDTYSLQDGQDLVYTNMTYSGMSGSAILDSEGRLIGINTASEADLEITEQGTVNLIAIGRSLGISLKHFLELIDKTNVKSEWLNIAVTAPHKIDRIDLTNIKKHFYTTKKQEYTGIIKDIDSTARNILVKIENVNAKKDFGSGVIIAKEDNAYYVITAHHLIDEQDKYQIVTGDGKTYSVQRQNIQAFPASDNSQQLLDIALIKFESESDYELATLGTYNLTSNWVFVSGFANNNNVGDVPLQPTLTAGKIKENISEFYNFHNKYQEENLAYTNVSYSGMSGGAILDIEGNLLGIHTAEDNVCNILNNEIKPGLSRGVSVISFLENLKESQSKTDLVRTDSTEPNINTRDISAIFEQLIGNAPPKNAQYHDWVNYGNYLWRLGLYPEAITAFEQALILKDKSHEANYGLGLIYLELEDYQKAVINFERATAMSYQPSYWRWLGYSYNLSGNYTEALSAYDKAIQIVPDNLVFFIEKGDVLIKLRRYQEAIRNYTQALNIKSHPNAYLKRSLIFYELRQYQKSLADYNRAIELDIELAQSYLSCNEHETNIKKYDSTLNNFKNNPLLSQEQENIKQYELAKSNLNKLKAIVWQLRASY